MRSEVHIWGRAVVTHGALRAFAAVYFCSFLWFCLISLAVVGLDGLHWAEWKRFPSRFHPSLAVSLLVSNSAFYLQLLEEQTIVLSTTWSYGKN